LYHFDFDQKEYRNKNFISAVEDMKNRINHFPLPPEAGEVRQMAKDVESRERARDNRNYNELSEEMQAEVEQARKQRVLSVVRNRLYGWKEMR
jgi:hypothetical protein